MFTIALSTMIVHSLSKSAGNAYSIRRIYSAAMGRVLALPDIILGMLDIGSKWRTLTAASMTQFAPGSTVAIGFDP